MARGGGANLVGGLCTQGAMFLIVLVIARFLDPVAVGRYAQCFALLSLLSLLSLSGLRAGLTRFVAVYLADDDAARTRGTVRMGLWLSAVSSVLIAVALAACARPLAGALHDPGLTGDIVITALALPASTISTAALSATQGWRSQRAYALIGQIFEPLVRFGLTVVALVIGLPVEGTLWAVAIGSWATAVLAVLALRRRLSTVPRARPRYAPRELFRFSTISWLSSLSSTGLIWADTLLLGFLGNHQIGLYNVSTRLVTVAVFVMAPINAAFAPHIARLYHQRLQEALRQAYAAATGWISRLSFPAFVVLLVFPGDLLHLYGPAFSRGATVTMVLAAGQMVNAVTGPCGTMLNMSGRVLVNMVDNVAVLALNVALNLWLIPSHGILGAAVAWSASLMAVNAARVLQVRHLMGVLPFGRQTAKGMASALTALLAALLVRALFADPLTELSVGIVLVVLTYVGTTIALGFSPEDRAVAGAIVGRGGRA